MAGCWARFDGNEEKNLWINAIKASRLKFKPWKHMNAAEREKRLSYLWR